MCERVGLLSERHREGKSTVKWICQQWKKNQVGVVLAGSMSLRGGDKGNLGSWRDLLSNICSVDTE